MRSINSFIPLESEWFLSRLEMWWAFPNASVLAKIQAHCGKSLTLILSWAQFPFTYVEHNFPDRWVIFGLPFISWMSSFSTALRFTQLFRFCLCFVYTHRDIPEDVLNTYCWIHSTYTVVDAFMKKQGLEVPFPGIDNSQGGRGPLTIKHNKYYQWVAFTLFFQVSVHLSLTLFK